MSIILQSLDNITYILSNTHFIYVNSYLCTTLGNLWNDATILLYIPFEQYIYIILSSLLQPLDLYKLSINEFKIIYKFLSFLLYDDVYIIEFIDFIINNNIILDEYGYRELEIKLCNNYLLQIDIEQQLIECNNIMGDFLCVKIFYRLYLLKYKQYEVIIKNNLKKLSKCHEEYNYYSYLHKYNTELSNTLKSSMKYILYIKHLNELYINYVKENAYDINNTSIIILKIQHFISNGADINYCDNFGWNASFYACYNENYELVKYLIDNGISCLYNVNGWNVLLEACLNNNYNIIEYILLYGNCDINCQSTNGITPLMLSCCYGNLKIIKLLLAYNADITLLTNDGHNVYDFINGDNKNEIIQLLCNSTT